MRAILIDPFTRSISEIDTDASLDEMYSILEVDLITVVRVNKDHAMILDDEGLLQPKITQEYFHVQGSDQPFAGRAMILGDDYGENRAATMTVPEVASLVTFLDKEKIDPEAYCGWTVTAF